MSEPIASEISAVLEAADVRTHTVYTHRQAAGATNAEPFDLVVAQAGSDSEDWYDLLISMRQDADLPILMLVPGSEAVAACFALGADDCMPWPSSHGELLARVAARATPHPTDGPAQLKFGAMSIDQHTREVHVGGEQIYLTPKEFELLVYLARAPGRTFTKEQILRDVWHSASEFQGIGTVSEHVYRLRRKLRAASNGTPWITTIGRVGYRFGCSRVAV